MKLPEQRLYLRFLFERLWLRVQHALPQSTIKGGAALQFRLPQARTTRDLDLAVSGVSPEDICTRLRAAAAHSFGDFIEFNIAEDPRMPELQIVGAEGMGRRMRIRASLNGKPLFSPFGLDVVVDSDTLASDQVIIDPLLLEAGFAPLQLELYPLVYHVAEKLHAYTRPRERPNSRVKDLPDLALISTFAKCSASELIHALHRTFEARKSHELPTHLPEPSATWCEPYANMAQENALDWPQLAQVFQRVQAFLNPLLAAELRPESKWQPLLASWTA